MSEKIEGVPKFRKRARLLLEIGFSIYFPLLLMMVNAVRSIQHPAGKSWVANLQSLIGRGGYVPSYHFAYRVLWAVSSAALFLSLRTLAKVSFSDLFLRTFAGIVTVAGFPLATGYVSFRGYLQMFGSLPRALLYAYAPQRWLAAEIIATVICIFLYIFLRWPRRAFWGLLLLSLHFAAWIWFVFSGGKSYLLTYPLLGLLTSLTWGLYVRQSTQSRLPAVGTPLSP